LVPALIGALKRNPERRRAECRRKIREVQVRKEKKRRRRKKLVANGRSRFEVIIIERFLFAVCNHDDVHFYANFMYHFHVSIQKHGVAASFLWTSEAHSLDCQGGYFIYLEARSFHLR